jgi:putative oxidoreductase
MRLLRTERDLAMFFLRLTIAVVLFPHGAQKIFGWFGGHGLEATLYHFSNVLGIPFLFGILAIAAEFLGSISILIGFLTRIVAFIVAIEMIFAAYLAHMQFGFFMNWLGQQKGEGFEYHILLIGICLALMLKGGGRWSVDRVLAARRHRSEIYLPIH